MKRRRSRYCGYVDGAHVSLSKPWAKMTAEEQKAIHEMIVAAKAGMKRNDLRNVQGWS